MKRVQEARKAHTQLQKARQALSELFSSDHPPSEEAAEIFMKWRVLSAKLCLEIQDHLNDPKNSSQQMKRS